MALLTCNQLSLGYDGREILHGISFSVQAGDYLCIVGENGSGKSTLMKTILGLHPPLSGELLTGDCLRSTEIGYLPQQTVIQKDFPASVREIVLSGCQGQCGLRPFYNKKEKRLAEEQMRRMEIQDIAGRCYRDLSGGQQQRVLLARALCAARRMLLLDEPVAGLDPHSSSSMYRIIEGLNQEGVAILMISHDLTSAVQYASHILHIGKQIFFGTKEEYIRSELCSGFTSSKGGIRA